MANFVNSSMSLAQFIAWCINNNIMQDADLVAKISKEYIDEHRESWAYVDTLGDGESWPLVFGDSEEEYSKFLDCMEYMDKMLFFGIGGMTLYSAFQSQILRRVGVVLSYSDKSSELARNFIFSCCYGSKEKGLASYYMVGENGLCMSTSFSANGDANFVLVVDEIKYELTVVDYHAGFSVEYYNDECRRFCKLGRDTPTDVLNYFYSIALELYENDVNISKLPEELLSCGSHFYR